MHKILTLIVLCLLAGCAQPEPPARPADPQPEFRTTATIQDIMDAIVDPSADYIWESVETTVSAKGIEEKRPQNDEEWLQVRRNAIMLLEATNLLQMPGRRVAKEGVKSENPDIELGPEQIQELIDKDRTSWIKYAQALHDATMDSFKAIDAKNAEELLSVSDRIDTACENCHKHYWYPNDVGPPAPSPASTEKKGS